ncbi:MAG TPA: hypothetical protein VF630_09035 [Hymenobacter sp.]
MPDWLYSLLQIVVNVGLVIFFSRRAYGRGYDDGSREQARLMRDIHRVLRDVHRSKS